MNGIKYKNAYYEINEPCIVNSGMYGMIISDKVYDIMKHNIFNSHKCDVIRDETSIYPLNSLVCNTDIINEKETIEIKFDTIIIKFKTSDLFNEERQSLFYSNCNIKKIHNFDGKILGIDFINQFNYSIFDYENHQMELYSDYIPIYVLANNTNIIILMICIVLLFCSVIQMVYLRYSFEIK